MAEPGNSTEQKATGKGIAQAAHGGMATVIMVETNNEKQTMDEPRQDTPPSKSQAWVWLVAFAGLLIILGLLLWQLPQISRYGITFLPGFVVYVMTGLVAAGFTFGALRSYARVSGQQFGLAIDAGGPAAMCLIVMFAGMYGGAAKETFGFSVYIEEAQTQAAVKTGGSATLQLDEPKNRAFQDGHARFTDIDARWRDKPLDLVIEADGYEPAHATIKLDEDGQVFRFGLKKN